MKTALKIVNAAAALLLVNQVCTGLLRDSLPFDVFVVLHQYGGLVFAGVAVLHVGLNWRWIRATYFKRGAGPSA